VGLPSCWQLLKFARDTQDLHKLHETMKETVSALDGRLRAVENRIIKMKAEQGQVVSDAKSAVTGAAAMIASAAISDAVTRVTRVEEGVRRLSTLGGALIPFDGAEARRTM
jgi:vacuolar-type H+-ATPase subunit D/Vma8